MTSATVDVITEDGEHRRAASFGRVRKSKLFMRRYPVIPVVILLIITGGAIFAPWLAPHGENAQSLADRLQPPVWSSGGSWDHILGTDTLGRDVLSRVMYGARTSMLVSAVAIAIGTVTGTLVALVAGNWRDSWIDTVAMRITDAALSLPLILVALLLAVSVGASFQTLIAIIALFIWARTARIVRGEVLDVGSRDYVTLARLTGASNTRIILRHLLPNVAHVSIVVATLEVGNVVLLEASLSFLGVGVPPPTSSWGGMVADGRDYISVAWWLIVVPAVFIMLTVISLNFLGDWLRDRLDPHYERLD